MTTETPDRASTNARLPVLVYVLAAGIFLMGTTEFMVAGLLPDVATDLGVDIAQAGLLVTAFAVGMIIGPPVMALATLGLPARATLIGTLMVFSAGHVVAAVSDSFTVVTASRVLTALATGTFWATGAVGAVAQAAGERDGDVRLAHRGGSEESDHACHGGYGAWSVRSHLLRDVPRDRSARGRG